MLRDNSDPDYVNMPPYLDYREPPKPKRDFVESFGLAVCSIVVTVIFIILLVAP
jgi:hypothetical protein